MSADYSIPITTPPSATCALFFVGSEAGGKAAAIAYTLIEAAKLNSNDSHILLADTLARIPDQKITKVDDLLFGEGMDSGQAGGLRGARTLRMREKSARLREMPCGKTPDSESDTVTNGRHAVLAIAWVIVVTSAGQRVQADGYFFQTDVGPETQSFVATAAVGAVNLGFNLSSFADGSSIGGGLTYTLGLGDGAVLKLGPSIGLVKENGEWEDPEFGARLSVERYAGTSFGSVYGLAEVNSIDNSWFVLGQLTFQEPGFGFELSRGGSDNYEETTLTVFKRLSDGPLSLRIGYKLSSEEVFVGFNVNTF